MDLHWPLCMDLHGRTDACVRACVVRAMALLHRKKCMHPKALESLQLKYAVTAYKVTYFSSFDEACSLHLL